MEETTGSKSWLQRLKDESWEAELLVSAVATFAAFQLFQLTDWTIYRAVDILHPDQYFYAYTIVFMGMIAVSVLVTMFVIHFMLRSYWIGLVGLNSVFPDYGLEDSAYSELYTNKFREMLPKLTHTIDQVDELCSVIFSAAFVSVVVYAYFGVLSALYLMLFNMLNDLLPTWLLLLPIFTLILLTGVQGLLTLLSNIKKIKDNDTIQLFLFRIVKLTNMIMLGPIYKSALQIIMTFGSNFKRKKHIAFMVMGFMFFGCIVAGVKFARSDLMVLINNEAYLSQHTHRPDMYRSDNSAVDFLIGPEISSDVINDTVLRVFIPRMRHEKTIFKGQCGEFETPEGKTEREVRTLRNTHEIACFQSFYSIFINDQETNAELQYAYHPTTNQLGFLTYIDLSNTQPGGHELNVIKTLGDELEYNWSVPFYYAPNSR